MAKGFDAASPVGGIIPKITAAKLDFVGRYYSYNPRKNLSRQEALALSTAGLNIVSVWEANGNNALAFSADQGTKDGPAAMACAAKVGQPLASAIYFAVDYDASISDLAQRITPYFQAVNHALSGKYLVGVYGSGLVCRSLKLPGLVAYTWLGGAMGWASSKTYAGYDILQGLPSDPYHFGFQIDPDMTRGGDYGAWKLTATGATA